MVGKRKLGEGGRPLGWEWEWSCLHPGVLTGAAALHRGGQSKERRGSLLQCCQPSPPNPGTLGAAVGQPTMAARQGRQDMGQGLLSATPGPSDVAANQGRDPVQGMQRLHPLTQQPFWVQNTAVQVPCACTTIYISTGCSEGGNFPVPSGTQQCSRDGEKRQSCCASHSPTPLGGTRHTQAHPPTPGISLCQLRFGTG